MKDDNWLEMPFLSYLRSLFVPPEEDTLEEINSSDVTPRSESLVNQETKSSSERVLANAPETTAENPPKHSIYKPLPATTFLATDNSEDITDKDSIIKEAIKLEKILSDYGISSKVTNIKYGPSVIGFSMALVSGTPVKKVIDLHDMIKASMCAESVRIIAPYPGKALVVIEVSLQTKINIRLRSLIENTSFKQSQNLTVPFGISSSDIKPYFHDLSDDSVFIISGFISSGKTNLVNVIICSILCKYSPDEVQFLMVDTNESGLYVYSNIPHLILPVAADYEKAVKVIQYAVSETERRLNLFTTSYDKSIDSYNDKCKRNGQPCLSHILLVIENYYELFRHSKDVGIALSQLSLKCKNAGIHILITTETASETMIPKSLMQGVSLKASFVQINKKESVCAIGESGAEDLLRYGDMLLRENTQNTVRIHTPLISSLEISKVIEFMKSGHNTTTPSSKTEDQMCVDELFNEAAEIVILNNTASVSVLQRNLGIGYTHAAKLIDQLEKNGIIGPFMGSKPRKVLISIDEWDRIKNSNL